MPGYSAYFVPMHPGLEFKYKCAICIRGPSELPENFVISRSPPIACAARCYRKSRLVIPGTLTGRCLRSPRAGPGAVPADRSRRRGHLRSLPGWPDGCLLEPSGGERAAARHVRHSAGRRIHGERTMTDAPAATKMTPDRVRKRRCGGVFVCRLCQV